MDLDNLDKVLEGQPGYRLKQAKEAVFKNFISDWSEATFFSKDLREKLNKECSLKIDVEFLVSKDKNSIKAKIKLKDGLEIEAVLMRHKDSRNTVCVSSQVGCPMACLFCATGKMGFKRNLSAHEILEQVIFFARQLKITNITFMGMGEPFLNYDNVFEAIRVLNDKNCFNIGARSLSVSTCGITEGIDKLSKEAMPINLAISLHAPNDNLRSQLMPINKKYNLNKIFNAVDSYIKITKRKVMFEYVLIKDVNDSEKCAKELVRLLRNPSTPLRARKLYFLNLILYNPVPDNPALKPSETKQVQKFKQVLKRAGINFVQRWRFGDDIKAACGQFATAA